MKIDNKTMIALERNKENPNLYGSYKTNIVVDWGETKDIHSLMSDEELDVKLLDRLLDEYKNIVGGLDLMIMKHFTGTRFVKNSHIIEALEELDIDDDLYIMALNGDNTFYLERWSTEGIEFYNIKFIDKPIDLRGVSGGHDGELLKRMLTELTNKFPNTTFIAFDRDRLRRIVEEYIKGGK